MKFLSNYDQENFNLTKKLQEYKNELKSLYKEVKSRFGHEEVRNNRL